MVGINPILVFILNQKIIIFNFFGFGIRILAPPTLMNAFPISVTSDDNSSPSTFRFSIPCIKMCSLDWSLVKPILTSLCTQPMDSGDNTTGGTGGAPCADGGTAIFVYALFLFVYNKSDVYFESKC